jgi:hypothetical protein
MDFREKSLMSMRHYECCSNHNPHCFCTYSNSSAHPFLLSCSENRSLHSMASLRRSKILSPDGQTAKFLYTIIRQLDLKTVDWNEVASGLDITNGHAARMRFSRFKAQIEGLPTQSSKPRAPRTKKDPATCGKGKGKNKPGYEPGKVDDLLKGEDADDGDVKMEQESGTVVKREGEVKVKQENATIEMQMEQIPSSDMAMVKPEPGLTADCDIFQEEANGQVKPEPTAEPMNFNFRPSSGIATMNIESYPTPPPTPTVSILGFSPPPPTPGMGFPSRQPSPMMPPHTTVSLADLHRFRGQQARCRCRTSRTHSHLWTSTSISTLRSRSRSISRLGNRSLICSGR